MVHSKGTLLGRIFTYTFLVIFLVWSVTPVFIIITNSFKPTLDITRMPPVFRFAPTLKHYQGALTVGDFALYFQNSFIIAFSTTLISIICGAMAAYGLLLMKSKVGHSASNFILIGKLVPSITILIPLYSMLIFTGLFRTHIGPILAHSSINLPFVAWLMLGFMKSIPKELRESGMIDGATRMQVFWRILLPMLMPAIGSALILSMQYSWNELIFSLQLTTMASYTLPVGIARFVGSVSVDWGRSSAAATMTMVPIIILGFFMQRYLVTGLTAGSVKE